MRHLLMTPQSVRHCSYKRKYSIVVTLKMSMSGKVGGRLQQITEVLIGPMRHQKEAKLTCEILLRDQGYANVKVNISNMPYR